uniref:Pentatricopeptide repeat-containing protein n=1 Tax=Ananas comosus var. bracteatus TaxID=296719 RepID=A0A6V7P025_ANACO|nr:unnamed protein product [Ananas comosus var. bracteatus]
MALFFHLRSLKPSTLTLPLLPSSAAAAPPPPPPACASSPSPLRRKPPPSAAAASAASASSLPLPPPQPQQQRIPKPQSNPNAPKLPEPNDLDEAALLTRHSIYSNCRPTVFTCNAVLNALLRQARYADLLSLHRFITQASVAPTVVTHNLLLQAYCDCRKTDIALEHFRLLLKDDSPVLPRPPRTGSSRRA